ncbi:MAG TPA: LysM peptidoglycan-binding domain-containing protein [Spirochaetia bacterium]|nr:LysM peptidoglycan-binding domain-containing protein [Spirochaetia bacterium]
MIVSDSTASTTVHIGLKLADGSFFPIFPEVFQGSKKLTLTTVRDNQESVQIDLYKGIDKEVFEDAYIGSLIIENITPAVKGDVEIELVIGIDQEGNLHARAVDRKSGEKQALSVSLSSLAQRASYDIPDFEIETTVPPSPVEEESEETLVGETYPIGTEDRRRSHLKKKKGSPLGLILFIILGLLLIVGIGIGIYFLLPWFQTQFGGTPSPTVVVASPSPTASPSPSPEATAAEDAALSPDTETATEEASTEESETADGSTLDESAGVWYMVVRGDTLWDLSRRYYRDPFQYMKIADAPQNDIKNPDLIFEAQRIFIPNK